MRSDCEYVCMTWCMNVQKFLFLGTFWAVSQLSACNLHVSRESIMESMDSRCGSDRCAPQSATGVHLRSRQNGRLAGDEVSISRLAAGLAA